MINFRIGIENPWAKDNFKSLYHTDGKLTKHKGWEFEVTRYARDLLEIHFRLTVRGTDHPGLNMAVSVLGYSVKLDVYDGRHWNYDNDCWELYTD